MAFEILNDATVTPGRLHALVQLVSRIQNPTREDLLDLLQPRDVPSVENQKIAGKVYLAASHCNLIAVGQDGVVNLTLEVGGIEASEDFQLHMQRILLGKIDENDDNYLLNLYTAWYAVQNDRVLRFDRKQFETRFNEEIFPDSEARRFNNEKLNGWRNWAAYVGSGYPFHQSTIEVLIPDAYGRLLPLLGDLLPPDQQVVSFDTFMAGLSDRCPELDGGVLFERCWQRSRTAEQRGNSLSLMLSTALRVLHDTGKVELQLEPDAAVRWQLAPAAGHAVKHVSHIRRRSN